MKRAPNLARRARSSRECALLDSRPLTDEHESWTEDRIALVERNFPNGAILPIAKQATLSRGTKSSPTETRCAVPDASG